MEWNEFRAKRKRFTSSVKQSEMTIRITPGTRDRLVGRLQQSTGCLKKSQNGRDDRQQEALLGYLGPTIGCDYSDQRLLRTRPQQSKPDVEINSV